MRVQTTSPAVKDRQQVVEAALRALGRPPSRRRVPPPEGRLGAAEERHLHLRTTVEQLGPVFAEFGRYLSSRVDLLPRRDCIELAGINGHAGAREPVDAVAVVVAQLGDAPDRRFFAIDPAPVAVTRWHQRHDAWLASGDPVTITIVRPDAAELLETDLPLLPLLAPWLDAPKAAVDDAVADFRATLTARLDQAAQAALFTRLFDDAEAGGTLATPRCYHDYCAGGVLTVERIEGAPITGPDVDRRDVAQRLASAWVRQAIAGRVVPFELDLRDVRLRDGRLVLIDGALEPMTGDDGSSFLKYLVAAAADEPDRAVAWIAPAVDAESGPTHDLLRRRLRQAVPFRDGEWSGDDRLAEHLLVHWRAARETGAPMLAHHLHLYRGVHAIAAATTALADGDDVLLAALHTERLRLGLDDAQRLLESRTPLVLETLLADLVDLPRRLDEVLTQAADGQLRVQVQMPHDEDRREARNRTVSLVASLVALVAITFLARHLAPAAGTAMEALVALLVLVIGGWLLVAASRL